jgi:hypothetical protein
MTSRLLLCVLLAFLGSTTSHAGPVENAIVAMMRLAEQPSYSWVATVTDDARTYDIVGRTTRDGFTHVKMPVVNTIRRRLGRGVTDTQIELYFRGNNQCVVETDGGWKFLHELPDAPARENSSGISSGSSAGSIGVSVPSLPPTGPARNDGRPHHYSNLQLGLSHPHEELAIIVSSHDTLTVEQDRASGTLNQTGAQLLLVRDGPDASVQPRGASGSFKVWLRDGMVTRFQIVLEGVVSVPAGSGRREIRVSQTTETIVKDVGTTRVEVPAQVRQKLGSP